MKTIITISIAAVIATLIGCEATARSDKNELTWQKTTSYEKIMAQKAGSNPIQPRNWKKQHAEYTQCVVTHFGSYFDDPFVIKGDGDQYYGWTTADLAAFAYCPARAILNAACIPLSMIKEPPGTLSTSNLDQKIEN